MFNLFADETLFRLLHIWFGIVWIGTLYYFNFMQTPFMAEADAATKPGVLTKLLPRAMWWFRWAAKVTFITGLVLFWYKYWDSMKGGDLLGGGGGLLITLGMLFGITMYLNVWCIIWPAQKIVIQNAKDVAEGKPANPEAALRAPKAAAASRTNTLFSFPMLFFMVWAAHRNSAHDSSHSLYWPLLIAGFLVFAFFEYNAIKGKLLPILKTVKSTVISGLVLWAFFYAITEVLKIV